MNLRETVKFRPGDLVEVKTPQEILSTLDAAGTIGQLPFMPEMIEYCGKRFRVSRTVVKVCASGMKTGSTLRGFEKDDVVVLDGLRCSGEHHDGCQKACTIFWRQAWLRKAEDEPVNSGTNSADASSLRARLKTKVGSSTYFCQASELLRATRELTRFERYTKWIAELRASNCSVLGMARRFAIFLYWKLRRMLFGIYAQGPNRATPTETLNLQAGEWVYVKPMSRIRETLDDKASNRGLWFSPNMRLLCDRTLRVERRIDKLIVDGSGEMRHLHNTVCLQGSFCSCAHIAFGGCSRAECVYWREIWLCRAKKPSD